MIAIVDYRGGNLASVLRALGHLGHEAVITDAPELIADAERVILPGVGSADETMSNLRRLGLETAINNFLCDGRPFLGICIGVQVIFENSEEDGGTECMGLVKGTVKRFPARSEGQRIKVPQIGWNQVNFISDHPLFDGVRNGQDFYFVNSYYPEPANGDNVIATSQYGIEFASVVTEKNLVATQFHLEKSGEVGLKMLDNFCRWDPQGFSF